MKADLSRTTFDRLKHFSRVVAQQGRVQLDADWNEQASLMLYQLRRLAADVIGPAGGPAGNLGFGLGALDAAAAADVPDFAIGAGHYYVQGILCELEATGLPATFADAGSKVRLPELSVDGRCLRAHQYVSLVDAEPGSTVAPVQARIVDVDEGARVLTLTDIGGFIRSNPRQPRLSRLTTFLTQPDGTPGPVAAGNFEQGPSLVYLDVWERLVTAARGRRRSARSPWADPIPRRAPGSSGRWRSCRSGAVPASRRTSCASACSPSIAAGCGPARDIAARRTISIASRSTTAAPAARRRSNGRATTARSSGPSPAATATRSSWGRSSLHDRRGLAAGDWVEIQDDDSVLANRAVPLLRVRSVDPGNRRVVLSGDLPAGVGRDASRHPLLRRWDNAAPVPAAASGQEGWLELEDGVEIQFVDPQESVYRTGDYWLIPARVATGDVEWPREALSAGAARRPLARLPAGVNHHYAPLGVVEWDGRTLSFGRDCRLQFSGAGPLAPRR